MTHGCIDDAEAVSERRVIVAGERRLRAQWPTIRNFRTRILPLHSSGTGYQNDKNCRNEHDRR